MKRNLAYIIGEKDGKLLTATESEIINNALQQEKDGVNPHFAFYDYKNQRPVTNKVACMVKYQSWLWRGLPP